MELEKSIEDQLSAQGIFIDDVHRLRILEPSSADQTHKFKEECDRFIQSSRRFETVIEAFRQEAVSMAAAVEKEKQRAIGLRLLVDSVVKKKEDDRRRLMVTIDERRMELERLRLELELTEKATNFHQETIDQFQMLH